MDEIDCGVTANGVKVGVVYMLSADVIDLHIIGAVGG